MADEKSGYTSSEVEAMVQEATAKANSEAASNRHALKDLQAKLDEIESEKKKAAEKKAAEEGELKGLLEQRNKEVEELSGKLAEVTGKVQDYVKRDEEEYTKIVAEIPEDAKEALPSESVDLKERLKVAKFLAGTAKKEAPDARFPSDKAGQKRMERKNFDNLTPAEKSKFVLAGGIVHD